ncbi:MAG: VWA domain-containing protein [Thermoanaerobaculia bacterium]|nr:VWA domain-containing protein [Thermoanaerobaculia bacterium]
MIDISRRHVFLIPAIFLGLLISGPTAPRDDPASPDDPVGPLLWPEEQQNFWFEGPAWLLPEEEREELLSLSEEARGRRMEAFLERDPLPKTPRNELREAIRIRRELMFRKSLSAFDERGRLLFLRGRPDERTIIDCTRAFEPLEIWRYGEEHLILYRPGGKGTYRLWLPLESKRVLYTREMELWLEEWEEVKGRVRGRRMDRRLCPEAGEVDRAAGISGLSRETEHRPRSSDLLRYLDAPSDLVAWVRKASATRLPPSGKALEIAGLETIYRERRGFLMDTALVLTFPPDASVETFAEEDEEEVRLVVDGVVETAEELLDEYRVRFVLDPPSGDAPIRLLLTEELRAGAPYRIRLRVTDEVGGGEARLHQTIRVPEEPDDRAGDDLDLAALSPDQRLDEQLKESPHGLVLLVPPREVVFGGMRARAAVRGSRIEEVVFSVDGEPRITRTAPPWTAELVLPKIPRPLIVRAEGLDDEGELVASDEVFLNQPRGRLSVEIVSPERGAHPDGPFTAEARITVPEGRRVQEVRFLLNDASMTRLSEPPWRAALPEPRGSELSFLTVEAELDDGSRAEEVRFLNTPYEIGEVDVQMVELYTTVLGRDGGMVPGLEPEDFRVLEDGRPQKIEKFELVEDRPLTMGVALDVSASMFASLREAHRTAVEFLDRIIGSRDQAFAVAFSSEPLLAMPRTEDVGAVAAALDDLRAEGHTALHDTVVFSIYYFTGVEGRRVLVLLSDGDDTDSRLEFEDALEYARQSPVIIYTIGLQNDALDVRAKWKLRKLAEATGGRSFFISRAEELSGIYRQIERELASQYLLAYASDQTGLEYRRVEVEVKRRGLDARTIPGYFPGSGPTSRRDDPAVP